VLRPSHGRGQCTRANRVTSWKIGGVVRRKLGTDVFRPQSGDHPEDETIPGLSIVRTEDRMTFASAPRAGERLAAVVDDANPEVVILECSAIPDFEYTALQTLTEAEEKLRQRGFALWLTALNPQAFKMVERSSLPDAVAAFVSSKRSHFTFCPAGAPQERDIYIRYGVPGIVLGFRTGL
jgi:MFS superfamily sulfate permease-like transporter